MSVGDLSFTVLCLLFMVDKRELLFDVRFCYKYFFLSKVLVICTIIDIGIILLISFVYYIHVKQNVGIGTS